MEKILDENSCTGCSACKNICPKNAIHMIQKEDGFDVPEINESVCINCGLCKKVCPVLNRKEEEIGLPESYACINKEESLRMKSSSGGIFYLLANEILKSGRNCFWCGV